MVLAVALVLSMSVCAFALSDENPTGTVEVKYGVAGGYEVTIPQAVDFANGLESTQTLSANNVLLSAGKTLTIAVGSGNDYNLVYDGNSKIPYTVTGAALITEAAPTALTVAAGETTGSQELTIATTMENIAKATKSGEHMDTLTFTCSVA